MLCRRVTRRAFYLSGFDRELPGGSAIPVTTLGGRAWDLFDRFDALGSCGWTGICGRS
jgi:hypothetical protein